MCSISGKDGLVRIVGQNHIYIAIQAVDLFTVENGYNGIRVWDSEIRILHHLKLISDVASFFICIWNTLIYAYPHTIWGYVHAYV